MGDSEVVTIDRQVQELERVSRDLYDLTIRMGFDHRLQGGPDHQTTENCMTIESARLVLKRIVLELVEIIAPSPEQSGAVEVGHVAE